MKLVAWNLRIRRGPHRWPSNEKPVNLTGTSITSYLIMHQKRGIFFPHGPTVHRGPGPPHYRGFTIALRHSTLGRTPLDGWSALYRPLPYNTQHWQETNPAFPAGQRPQTHALDRAATAIDIGVLRNDLFVNIFCYLLCWSGSVLNIYGAWEISGLLVKGLNVRTQFFTLANDTAIFVVQAKRD